MADLRSTAQHTVVRIAVLLTLAFCCGCPMAPPSQQKQKIPSRWISVESAGQDAHPASSELWLAHKDVNVIGATVPTVMTLVAERVGKGTAMRGMSETEIWLSGTEPEYFQLLADATNAELARGRFLTDADMQAVADVTVIDESVAETLFGNEPAVGQTLSIGVREFTVVGVLSYSHRYYVGDVKRNAFIPIGVFDLERLQLDGHSGAELDRIWVKVDSLDQVPATQKIIQNLLGQRHPGTNFVVR